MCVLKSKLVFASITLCLSENRNLFFEVRRIPKLLKLEFVECTPTARDTEDSLSSTTTLRTILRKQANEKVA